MFSFIQAQYVNSLAFSSNGGHLEWKTRLIDESGWPKDHLSHFGFKFWHRI